MYFHIFAGHLNGTVAFDCPLFAGQGGQLLGSLHRGDLRYDHRGVQDAIHPLRNSGQAPDGFLLLARDQVFIADFAVAQIQNGRIVENTLQYVPKDDCQVLRLSRFFLCWHDSEDICALGDQCVHGLVPGFCGGVS